MPGVRYAAAVIDLTVLHFWCVWLAACVQQRETDAVAYLIVENQILRARLCLPETPYMRLD